MMKVFLSCSILSTLGWLPQMSSSTETRMEGPLNNPRAKRERSRILAGIAVLAMVLLLLGWGLSAMQWTILTTDHNVNAAAATHMIQTATHLSSIRLGVKRHYFVYA